MHQQALTLPTWPSRCRQYLLWAALAWIATVCAAAIWIDLARIDTYHHDVQSAASRHLDTARQNLDASLSEMAALAHVLAEQGRFADFLTKEANQGMLDAPPQAEAAQQRAQAPAVLAMNQSLDALVQDFEFHGALLVDHAGLVVADSAYREPGSLLGATLTQRPVVADAQQQGSGFEFVPASEQRESRFLVSARLPPTSAGPGVLVLFLKPENLTRLSGDAGHDVVMLTDRLGTVMASSRGTDDQGRQVPMLATGQGAAGRQATSQQVLLPWRVRPVTVAQQALQMVDVDGVPHLALSGSLPRHPYGIWVLAPLSDSTTIHITSAATALTLILVGLFALLMTWQRLERLRLAEEARRTAMDTMASLPLTVYRYNVDTEGSGSFTYIGPGAQALLGQDEARLQERAAELWQRMGQTDGRPPTQLASFEIDSPAGRRWLRGQAHASQRPDGSQVFDGYWQDITARRLAELRYQALHDHSPIGVLLFHRDDGILDTNQAALKLFGASTLESLKGRHPWRAPLSPPHQSGDLHSEAQARVLLDRSTTPSQPVHFEWRHTRLDGTRFDAAATLLPFEHEGPGLCLVIIDDITARRQTEEALRLASESASANARAKTAFLANMSHEIRTPMNAVIGMTHLALTDPHPDKLKAYVSKAHQAAKSLLQIINDILDLSRIEAGQLELECIEFPLQGVIDQLADVLGLQAEQKGLELLFTSPPDLPTHLLGDPTRLRQILLNLGSNAIKFTDQGSVTMGLEVQSRRGYEVVLHGWVRDTGIGIDREHQSLLFKPFNQVDASSTRRFGGSGLGLSICRQLLVRMGGQLWVESTLGQGSTFHFTMKTDLPAGQAGQAVLRHDWTGKRALLADDNADAREVLSKMLSSLGVEVHSVANGAQALAALAGADKPYDWVLLDWKMPQMDGVQCARLMDRQVQQQSPQNHPCILLVTAFNREDALEAAQGVPLADVLTKPVTPATLFESLKRSFMVRPLVSQAPLPEEPSIPTDLLTGTRILLVEDQPLNQELARDLMELAGATVVCAENGALALTALAREGPFDCVLMDCQMPVMDGYTCTLKIRSQPQWQQLPIIAMTASAMSTDREHALNSGMNDHITKPLDVHQTYQVVSKWINASRALQREAAPR